MPRFFIDYPADNEIMIVGDDARHISRSLRMNVGDSLTVCDQKGYDYDCTIKGIEDTQVLVKILKKRPNLTEPNISVTLYQALPKGDKLDFIMQKAVELGVSKIVPVLTERCISRPKPDAMKKKIKRLQSIVLEAAKQSERGVIPKIGELISFQQAIDEMVMLEKSLLFYENAEEKLSQLLPQIPKELGIMVGSEGGFSVEEVEFGAKRGIAVASLGKRILRCETAPIVALSGIMLLAEEF